MTQTIELGLDTFGDVTVDEHGKELTQADALRHVVEQGARSPIRLASISSVSANIIGRTSPSLRLKSSSRRLPAGQRVSPLGLQ